MCTSDALRSGYCDSSNLGRFIIDLPEGKTLNETSFWTARVGFSSSESSSGSDSTSEVLWYDAPIQYPILKTGFYCVAIVPVTVLPEESSVAERQADTDVSFHPSYSGVILFKNTFNGNLPASDYPKVTFYSVMLLAYAAMATGVFTL